MAQTLAGGPQRTLTGLSPKSSSKARGDSHGIPNSKRRCVECSASETPQWRQGPTGPQTLCNACGVRYSRLLRRQRTGRKRQPADCMELVHPDVSDTNTDSGSKEGVTIALNPLGSSPADEGQHSDEGSPMALLPALPCHTDQGLHTAFALGDAAVAAALAAAGTEEDTLVCEAALNLLSMSSGQRPSCGLPYLKSEERSLPRTLGLAQSHSRKHTESTRHNRQHEVAHQLPATAHESQQLHQPDAKPVRDQVAAQLPVKPTRPHSKLQPEMCLDLLPRLLPVLTEDEMSHLKDLCVQFDSLRKELAAAQAARDAVAQVLSVKQEEAKQADDAAAMAARALHEEARKLSGSSDAALQQQWALAAAVAGCSRSAADQGAPLGAGPRKCSSPKRARLL